MSTETHETHEAALARGTSADDGGPARERPPRRWLAWLRGLLLLALVGAVVVLFTWKPDDGPGGGPGGGAGAGRRPTAVAAAPVAVGTVVERASYPGELDADAADVAANVAGRLLVVDVRLGDAVTTGQMLARVDDSDLQRQRDEADAEARAARAARRSAAVRLSAARREAERARGLAKERLVSAQQADQRKADVDALSAEVEAATAREAQATARIRLLEQRIADCAVLAPFDGVVAARLRDAGGYVQPGTPLVRLVARAPLRIRFEVPEPDVGGLAPGTTFAVTAPPTGEQAVEGRVAGVGAESQRDRRIVPVEGIVDAPPAGWLPGMYARVVAVRRRFEDVPRLPGTAVVKRLGDGGTVTTGVFRTTDGVAHWVPVRILGREGDHVAVEGPLAAGDRVLVSGHTELQDGAPIRVVSRLGGEREEDARTEEPTTADAGQGRP